MVFVHEGDASDAVEMRVGGSGATREATVTAEGGTFTGKISATVSAAMPAGAYRLEIKVTNSEGDVRMVDGGDFDLLPSIAQDGEGAVKPSWAEQALAKAEALLVEAADSANSSISVEGISMTFATRAELVDFRNRMREAARVERYERRNPGAMDDPAILAYRKRRRNL